MNDGEMIIPISYGIDILLSEKSFKPGTGAKTKIISHSGARQTIITQSWGTINIKTYDNFLLIKLIEIDKEKKIVTYKKDISYTDKFPRFKERFVIINEYDYDKKTYDRIQYMEKWKLFGYGDRELREYRPLGF